MDNLPKQAKVIDLVAFKGKKQKKDLITCQWCRKIVDRTGWPVKEFMCNVTKGTHEPYQPYVPPRIG